MALWGQKKLLKVISNATYCAPRMGPLLVIKVILCTIKKRTWWSMELFHINFVNLSTPQLLTQKVHGCLYEKFHFNFNISFALSFCRSQNVLCRSKFFEPAQKFFGWICIFANDFFGFGFEKEEENVFLDFALQIRVSPSGNCTF